MDKEMISTIWIFTPTLRSSGQGQRRLPGTVAAARWSLPDDDLVCCHCHMITLPADHCQMTLCVGLIALCVVNSLTCIMLPLFDIIW